jgi:ankyrin repeat protein
MDDWQFDTEENTSDTICVPILNFQLSRGGRGIFEILCDDQVPSDEEPIQDTSILEFPEVEVQKERLSQISCLESLQLYSYTLHLLVFRADLNSIHDLWINSNEDYKECINLVDFRGNTPLMLAVKLASTGKQYERVFRFLLHHQADPHIKDSNGWSVMEEAVSQKNKSVCLNIFDYLHQEKIKKWLRNKHIALNALKSLPNFYIEMKWEFDSNLIPLVSHIAPHDICKFWKYGTSFRLDTTLVGWKKLRSKRRNMSFYFKPVNDEGNIEKEVLLANHSKQTIVYPFEPLDAEEKSAVVGDIMNTEPMQGDVKVLSYKIKPCENWRGKPVVQSIGPWKTAKVEIGYKGQMKYKKKNKDIRPCSETEYFETDIYEPVTAQLSYPSSNEPIRTLVKKSKAYVWLSENFPFALQEFLPVLELVGESNPSIKKLHNFLAESNLLNTVPSSSFPVKIDIPLTMTVKAVVTFEKFQIIDDPAPLNLPNYSVQSRKTAQKILTCPKKRLFLANLVI